MDIRKEMSKIDTFGCFLSKLGETIQKVDDKFADEDGNIRIKGINNILTFAGFTYIEFKDAYENCLGKEFTIDLDNEALETLIELVFNLLSKAGAEKSE